MQSKGISEITLHVENTPKITVTPEEFTTISRFNTDIVRNQDLYHLWFGTVLVSVDPTAYKIYHLKQLSKLALSETTLLQINDLIKMYEMHTSNKE